MAAVSKQTRHQIDKEVINAALATVHAEVIQLLTWRSARRRMPLDQYHRQIEQGWYDKHMLTANV